MVDLTIVGRPFKWHIILPSGHRAGVYRFKYQAQRDIDWYRWMDRIRTREANLRIIND